MSPAVIIAAALSAVLALFIVHALYRGARRVVTVASLKPFEPESRPRLTLASLTERALLACRIALFALVATIAFFERPLPGAGMAGGDVVAVVPGTPAPATEDEVRTVWLDGRQTPVDAAPVREDVAAGALLALAQSVEADARLSVAGALPARDWPAEMPVFGRDIDWRGGDRRPAGDDGWRDAGGPSRIVVVGDDAMLAAAVDEALMLWRGAGLLPESVTVDTSGSTESAAVIALDGAGAANRDWYANVTRARASDASGVVYDAAEGTGAFATALWHALTNRAGQRPSPGTVVSPEPSRIDGASVVRGNTARRASTPVAPAWLLLAVALFAAERWLAARGATR